MIIYFQVGIKSEKQSKGYKYHLDRIEFVKKSKENGIELYPHEYRTESLQNIKIGHSSLEDGKKSSSKTKIAGRVHSIRHASSKLKFIDIYCESEIFQVSRKIIICNS